MKWWRISQPILRCSASGTIALGSRNVRRGLPKGAGASLPPPSLGGSDAPVAGWGRMRCAPLFGGLGESAARWRSAGGAREERTSYFDDPAARMAVRHDVILFPNPPLVEQPAHGGIQRRLADLGHFRLPLFREHVRGVVCAPVVDEHTGQGQAAQDLEEDVLGLTFGLQFLRRWCPVLAGELPRDNNADAVAVGKVHVHELPPGGSLRRPRIVR